MALCYQCFREKGAETVCPFCGYDPTGAADKYPLALRPGTILNGRYTVGRVLGQGGFGITYIAQEYRTRERVALKEYFPSEFAGRSQGLTVQVHSSQQLENYEYGKARFLEEAKTLAAFIGNENIVRIYSYFEENGTAYFAMEYVDGLPLDQYMARRGGRLSPAEANRLLLPLMAALEAVHLKGIVHRDIAPDNIIIAKDGTAKLIDFGAARYSTGEKSKSLDVIIKHGFAPKEQYMRRGRQGPFTDIYALAASYYYAITGKVPPEAIERLDEDNLIPPRMLGIKLSSEAEDALFKALEVNAADRFQSMAEFYQAMKAASAPEGEEERRERELREELARLEQKRREREAREEAERLELARQERESREREKQEKLAREKAEREAKEKAEREARAEAERRRKEEKERQAREKAERAEREKQEKARREALKKAEREAARAARQAERETRPGAGTKKSKLPLVLAAVLVLALGVFGVSRFTGKNTPAVTEAPAVTEVSPEPTPKPTPEPIPVHFKAIAAGYNHSVALLENGRVIAVGDNQAGQCDTESWRDIVAIAAGARHTVGLKANGTVVAVGDNTHGECNVSDWSDICAIRACSFYTFGIKADGTVVALGDNRTGQLDVQSWRDIRDIAATRETASTYYSKHYAHTCRNAFSIGLRKDGSTFTAGKSTQTDTYQPGRTGGKEGHEPVWPDFSDAGKWQGITKAAAGDQHVLGLKEDGTVLVAGDDTAGQCEVSAWANVVDIAAGYSHSVGVTDAGNVLAKGSLKAPLSAWKDIATAAVGKEHAVGLRKDGSVVVAGDNSYGQCDMDALMEKARAAEAEEAMSIVSIKAGTNHTVALYADGTAAAVGLNYYGQCDVAEWSELAAVSASGHTVGLRKNGTVVATGLNEDGQCNVSTWRNIKAVAAGGTHTLGLKQDGTVVAVGSNEAGQCDVSDWTGIVAIAAGYDTSVGLKADGTVVAAGNNTWGQCDVDGWQQISAVAAGKNWTVGLREDGTILTSPEEQTSGRWAYQITARDWKNIISASISDSLLVGLHSDGTIELCQTVAGVPHGELKAKEWSGIQSVDVGGMHVVGLLEDGTPLAAGDNSFGQCDVASLNRVSS